MGDQDGKGTILTTQGSTAPCNSACSAPVSPSERGWGTLLHLGCGRVPCGWCGCARADAAVAKMP
eukprot:366474-Chlamydomonas_euryale.AAC.26